MLRTEALHKTYGKLTALNQVSLEIEQGQIFGLLGPNGSGKSTILGIILGVTNATSGDYEWFGNSSNVNVRKRIGSILEKPNFYENFSARKNLEIVCQIKEVEFSRIEEVLHKVGLLERQYDRFKTYSLGMKQRLAIASALLADPEVMILDEPTNGLDPQGILDIRQLILTIANSGKTIILASHLLDEVQKVCTHFGILNKGNLVHTGPVHDSADKVLMIEVGSEDLNRLIETTTSYPSYLSHVETNKGFEVQLRCGKSVQEFNQFLVDRGITINHLVTKTRTLEQQFLEILENHD